MGFPGFSDASLPACHGLRTPADLHLLALSEVRVLPSGALKPSASATSAFRSCTSTSGCAVTPAAYRILCLRFAHVLCAVFALLRTGRKTRYGWVANPCPTGTFTPQETPSFSRRDNAGAHLLPEAGARYERTLEAVRCSAWLGLVAAGGCNLSALSPAHRHPTSPQGVGREGAVDGAVWRVGCRRFLTASRSL
jgi:hypothetical protein